MTASALATLHPANTNYAPVARLDDQTLDQLFREARTQNGWLDRPVPEHLLWEAVDLAKMAPTSVNSLPMRVTFVRSQEAKQKLIPALSPGNVEKTQTAPVTAIVGHDLAFYEHLPRLFPHADARSWFVGKEAFALDAAFRNGTLQGAYLIMALRSLGLDVGPMSGFDAAKLDAEFFPDGRWQSNFIINLGYGDAAGNHPRGPRLPFAEAARIL